MKEILIKNKNEKWIRTHPLGELAVGLSPKEIDAFDKVPIEQQQPTPSNAYWDTRAKDEQMGDHDLFFCKLYHALSPPDYLPLPIAFQRCTHSWRYFISININ